MGDSLERLTHLDARGKAQMVDVGTKEVTRREAVARAFLSMQPTTLEALPEAKKGDVEAVARVAAIMAAKKTSELIPLCHPLALSKVTVDFQHHPPDRLEVLARVICYGQTGVEMEALTAVTVAALTVYDMVKARDRGISIGPVELLEKSGGASGHWRK